MEFLEQEAIASAPLTIKPILWKRYVDDIHEEIQKGEFQNLTDHLNTVDETGSIKFTHEEESKVLVYSFSGYLNHGTVELHVYLKKTQTYQYLDFSSHHRLQHKMSVVRTLLGHCYSLVNEEEDRTNEGKHINNALVQCGYPEWTIKSVKQNYKTITT